MPNQKSAPWRRVVVEDLQCGGTSIFHGQLPLGCIWELTLTCGHTVLRQVKYKPQERVAAGKWAKRGWHHRRQPEDALPAPKTVRCERCKI